MHDVIIRLAPELEGLIFDLFTSRTELKDNGFAASITYVRFPYYLGTSVVTLCGELNIAFLGQYALKAEFYFGGGRQKLTGGKRSSPSYTAFEMTVGGRAIPHLSADEKKQINGKPDLDTIQENYWAILNATEDQVKTLALGFSFLGDEYYQYTSIRQNH